MEFQRNRMSADTIRQAKSYNSSHSPNKIFNAFTLNFPSVIFVMSGRINTKQKPRKCMTTNIREEIDKALVASLQTSTLIQRVTREFVGVDLDTGAIEEISHLEMPAVIVNTGNESGFTEMPGGKTRVNYSPEIVGYVYDEDEYFERLNSLIAETKIRLFTNRRINYNSECVGVINGIAAINTDRGRLAPYGAFSMTLDIVFDYVTSTGGELVQP